VARDAGGSFLDASAVYPERRGLKDAEIAEALACRDLIREFRLATECANFVKSLSGPGNKQSGNVSRP
jgi:hypothetical protein